MEWSRMPKRGGPPNSFEKPAVRKLKCVYKLRSSGCRGACARGSEVTQTYWAARGVHKSEIIRKAQYSFGRIPVPKEGTSCIYNKSGLEPLQQSPESSLGGGGYFEKFVVWVVVTIAAKAEFASCSRTYRSSLQASVMA